MIKPPSSLAILLKSARSKQIPKGQILLYEGDIPHEVYILKSGFVKLYDIDENGNEKVLHIIKQGSIFPFIFFSDEGSGVHWFYGALTDCELYVFTAPEMQKSLLEDNNLSRYFTNIFSREVHELLVRLSSLGKTNTSYKLVAALKFLQKQHSRPFRGGWSRIEFPVNHQLLADMIGVSRESTSLAMKELQDKKVIRYSGQTILEVHKESLCA